MLAKNFYYYQTVKKIIAVFGTLMNNVKVGRMSTSDVDGNTSDDMTISNFKRVPIAYGPRQKFLDRITEQKDLSQDKIAIKVPRMSYELTGIAYDTAIKLNRMNSIQSPSTVEGDLNSVQKVWQSVPYRLTFELNIFGRNQDDVMQILEQILPMFQPEYTVSIKELDAPNTSTNVPFTLTGISLSDSYDGDFATTRRAIVYTLTFDVRVKFHGPTSNVKVIKFVEAQMIPDYATVKNPDAWGAPEYVHVYVNPDDTKESYTVHTSIDEFDMNVISLVSADSTLISVDSINTTSDQTV